MQQHSSADRRTKQRATARLKRRAKRKNAFATLRRESATHELLRLVAVGTLIVGAAGILAVAPGLAYASRLFSRRSDERRRHQHRVREAARRLEKRGLIRVVHEGEHIRIDITEEGQRTLLRTEFATMRLKPHQKKWDGMWRIVLFDITEEQKPAREALRRLLLRIGFYPLQKSVFVTPVPCRNEVRDIATAFNILKSVLYLETDRLGEREEEVRAFFGL